VGVVCVCDVSVVRCGVSSLQHNVKVTLKSAIFASSISYTIKYNVMEYTIIVKSPYLAGHAAATVRIRIASNASVAALKQKVRDSVSCNHPFPRP
jgi:hypothetical protein